MKRVIAIPLLVMCLFAAGGPAAAESQADAMAREHAGDRPVPAAAAGEASRATGGPVRYGSFEGYAAQPDGEPRGGLVVIHEWWGLNDNVREMTRRLAAEGYLALAVDLYGGQVADSPDGARQLMSSATESPERMNDNLRAAYGWLEANGASDIGSIGWCFGGGVSLRMAMLYPEELDAAVIYYGHLVTDREQLAPLDVPILGIFGGADQGIPVEKVREFESALASLGKPAEIHVYPGAAHAFANPSGTRYDPEAAEDAWRETLDFLERHLAAD